MRKISVIGIADHILKTQGTIRSCAKDLGISRSTVHRLLTDKLPRLSYFKYRRVRELLDKNYAERGKRGGAATRLSYQNGLKKQNKCN